MYYLLLPAVWFYGTSTIMHSHFTDGAIVAVSHLPEVCCCCSITKSGLTLCNPMDCSAPGLLCPWDSPGKNTGVGCHALLQGIFPTQGSNPRLLHWQVDSLPLSHQWSPAWVCTANNWRNYDLLISVWPQPRFWVFWLQDSKWDWPYKDDAGDVLAWLMLAAIHFVSRSSDGSLCFCVDFFFTLTHLFRELENRPIKAWKPKCSKIN